MEIERLRFQSVKLLALFCALTAGPLFGQLNLQPDTAKQPGEVDASKSSPAETAAPVESKRILGIIPNYRTSPTLHPYSPISPGEKFKLARQDAFDQGTFVLAALFAGQAQLTNSNRAFGQGASGFGQYLAASYGDYVIGDYMTEGVFPTLLHQDPRYFRKGTGSGWSRLAYAAGQVIVTHSDKGDADFNYSEILGNATGVAISMSYYRDNRDASDAIVKLVTQVGVDAASNILKEFWPEVQRKFSRKSKASD